MRNIRPKMVTEPGKLLRCSLLKCSGHITTILWELNIKLISKCKIWQHFIRCFTQIPSSEHLPTLLKYIKFYQAWCVLSVWGNIYVMCNFYHLFPSGAKLPSRCWAFWWRFDTFSDLLFKRFSWIRKLYYMKAFFRSQFTLDPSLQTRFLQTRLFNFNLINFYPTPPRKQDVTLVQFNSV